MRCPVLFLLVGAALAALASCGARTALEASEVCGNEGELRTCFDACGEGEQLCDGSYWGECLVPATTRACSNLCGAGVEECTNGQWHECRVALVTESCQTDCGSGTMTCTDGAWSNCDVPPVTRDCMTVCGAGKETCTGGSWQPCDAPQPKPPQLKSVIRDFSDAHADMEIELDRAQTDRGIVLAELGADDKPVYAGDPTTATTSGQANFDQWYRDVPGVNASMPLDLQLSAEPGEPVFFVYDNHAFFPIDHQLLGNEGRTHNFHFTLEAQTSFTYIGGEVFTFSGDDDMWVFINRRLAIDLGGLHASQTASVKLDEMAAGLGIALGQTYPLHFFFAERHTVESNFTIRTTIAEQGSCE